MLLNGSSTDERSGLEKDAHREGPVLHNVVSGSGQAANGTQRGKNFQ